MSIPIRVTAAVVMLGALTACSESGDGSAPEYRPAQPSASASAPASTPAPAPSEPVALAQRLVAAERTVRDPRTSPADLRGAAVTAQAGYRTLELRPDWDAAVLAAVPPEFAEIVRLHVDARRNLAALHDHYPDQMPAWRIVAPAPPEELRGYYDEAQARFGVPWEILAAVNLVESGVGRIVGLSIAGAQGPMQFLPATWERYGLGGDVWNPRDAILGAANYLAANGGGGDLDNPRLDNALYRYNNDARYGRAVRDYAAVMRADPRSFLGFHAWEVVYRTSTGDIVLPVGYHEPRPIPVAEWKARQPG